MADTIDTKTLREAYVRDGYVIVDGIFAGKEKSMEQLRSAAADVVALTLRGDWPHRRVVGKQYPPYDEVTQDYWGVQHLMHPSLPHHELFAQFYASSPLLDVAAALLGAPEERVQLELFNLLVNPEKHAFALGWHRDDVRPELDEEEEKKVLATETFGVSGCEEPASWPRSILALPFIISLPTPHILVGQVREKQAIC